MGMIEDFFNAHIGFATDAVEEFTDTAVEVATGDRNEDESDG